MYYQVYKVFKKTNKKNVPPKVDCRLLTDSTEAIWKPLTHYLLFQTKLDAVLIS